MHAALAALIAAALAVSLTSTNTLAGPYEDCILQHMKGVQSDVAARAIQRVCMDKTAPPDTTSRKCRDLQTALKKASDALSAAEREENAVIEWEDAERTRRIQQRTADLLAGREKPRKVETDKIRKLSEAIIAKVNRLKPLEDERDKASREYEACVEECSNAWWWSRTFGECKAG